MLIKQKNNQKFVIIMVVFAAIILATTIYAVYAKSTGGWPFNSSKVKSTTPQDKKQAATAGDNSADTTYGTSKDQSNQNVNSEAGTSQDQTAKSVVTVSVTSADTINDNVEVRAYVSGVIEGTGTCTATLSSSSKATVTGTSQGFVNATSTQCETISIPKSQVPSGLWKVVVSYNSPTSTGTSPALQVTL